MKYLILGSSGQIGGHLTQWLEARGEQVVRFDLVNGPDQDLRIAGNSHLEECLRECDFVFFLAFDVGGSRYLRLYQETFEFISNNVRLMEYTFEALRRHKKPVIFASSQMSNMTFSSYGTLKALGDHYVKTVNGLVVKFWNIYGIEHDLEKSHVITDFILKAMNSRVIDMISDGREERQMLYADDCCECLYLLANRYDSMPRDRQLHISSFSWTRIIDIANLIAGIFPGTKVIPANLVDDVQRAMRNEPDRFVLDYWQPKTNLDAGIRKVAEYYAAQAATQAGKS